MERLLKAANQQCDGAAGEASDGQARLFGRWILLFVSLGVLWRVVRYALGFPLWGDETYLCISILHHDYAGLLREPLEYYQVAPLGFLWAQRAAFDLFGGGEYALRIVPLVAGLLTMLIFLRLARRQLGPRAAAISVGIFACSYAPVRHAVEAKPYATDLLIAALLIWIATRWIAAPRRALWPLSATAVAALGVWCSFPAVFVAGGVGLTLLWVLGREGNRRAWLLWLIYNAAVVGSFAGFYAAFAQGQSARSAGSWLEDYWLESFPPTSGVGAFLWWALKIHTGKMFAYPFGGSSFGSTGTTLFCIVGAIWMMRSGRGRLLLLLAAPALLTFIAALLHRYPYGGDARISLYLAPAICLTAGAGAAALIERIRSQRARDAAGGAVGLLLIVVPLGGLALDMVNPYKIPEYELTRRAMRSVAERISPGDVVAIVNPELGRPGPPDGPAFHQSLRYYLEHYAGVTPRWCAAQPLDSEVDWIIAFRGTHFGPDRARIEELLSAAGLSAAEFHEYPLSERWNTLLTVCRSRAE